MSQVLRSMRLAGVCFYFSQAIVKPLSKHTVTEVSELLTKIPGISSLNLSTYQAAILLHNITGQVLADCELDDLKPVLEMKFGDWQLFRSTILGMCEEMCYLEVLMNFMWKLLSVEV